MASEHKSLSNLSTHHLDLAENITRLTIIIIVAWLLYISRQILLLNA